MFRQHSTLLRTTPVEVFVADLGDVRRKKNKESPKDMFFNMHFTVCLYVCKTASLELGLKAPVCEVPDVV